MRFSNYVYIFISLSLSLFLGILSSCIKHSETPSEISYATEGINNRIKDSIGMVKLSVTGKEEGCSKEFFDVRTMEFSTLSLEKRCFPYTATLMIWDVSTQEKTSDNYWYKGEKQLSLEDVRQLVSIDLIRNPSHSRIQERINTPEGSVSVASISGNVTTIMKDILAVENPQVYDNLVIFNEYCMMLEDGSVDYAAVYSPKYISGHTCADYCESNKVNNIDKKKSAYANRPYFIVCSQNSYSPETTPQVVDWNIGNSPRICECFKGASKNTFEVVP